MKSSYIISSINNGYLMLMTSPEETVAPQGNTHLPQNTKELLEQIRARPAMFIDRKSIHYLSVFLTGWIIGCGTKSEVLMDNDALYGFQIWIEKKYKIRTSHSWARIIDFYSPDESYAFDKFYELYDEFTKLKNAGKLKNLERTW
ncbi:hypothetical protein [Hymenobacter koreensis]|uniref:Uncharacterized protein n=1 Tax=Hymenobacter koreensis TaxID=1084523 RepID=A0ABP8J948_9BACT